jgi:hypothetical protein
MSKRKSKAQEEEEFLKKIGSVVLGYEPAGEVGEHIVRAAFCIVMGYHIPQFALHDFLQKKYRSEVTALNTSASMPEPYHQGYKEFVPFMSGVPRTGQMTPATSHGSVDTPLASGQ